MPIKKYLYLYIALLLTVASLLAAFNAIVDPYMLFHTERISNFNDKKPALINRAQLYKPYSVVKVAPQTIIVGNSRPEMGLDPRSTCWLPEHGTVYSLTFPGLSAYGQTRALFHGMASGNVKHALLGLDFADALYRRGQFVKEVTWPAKSTEFFDRLLVDEQDKENPRQWLAKVKDTFMALFSLDTLFDSLYTVAFQSPNSPDRTPLGFNPAMDYVDIVRHEGEWVLFSQKLDELESRFSKVGLSIFDTVGHWSIELEGLRRAIELAVQRDIHLTLFINPYHYTYLESIRDAGYWDEFEQFKRSLKDLVDDYAGGKVELWDFSLYSSYTVSPVPLKGSANVFNWFWEPAHYKAALGDIMLAELFGKQCVPEKNETPLGVRLNEVDIGIHLRNQNEKRVALLKDVVNQ